MNCSLILWDIFYTFIFIWASWGSSWTWKLSKCLSKPWGYFFILKTMKSPNENLLSVFIVNDSSKDFTSSSKMLENVLTWIDDLNIYKISPKCINWIDIKFKRNFHDSRLLLLLSIIINLIMNEYIVRGVQVFIAIILFALTISRFAWNHIGQNIINLTAVGIFLLGFDNLCMIYRFYINKQSF